MTENIYHGIKEVMQIDPDHISRCEPCGYLPDKFADAINHYISNHGYKLLHIGSQSALVDGKNLVSDILALLGK